MTLNVTAGFAQTNALCLACGEDGVFPVAVSLASAATGVEFSRAHTLVPAFNAQPKPVQVSWLWPLIDAPHRSTSATVFTDDNLAQSVSPGGRLDRALRVPELVKGKVRLTLVIDPDLIDALTVMSHGYTVRTATTESAGTGQTAAAAWLKRLHAVAAYDDVSLTGYADPDVDALVRRNVGYSTTLSPQVEQRVAAVLGTQLSSDVAWPPGENLTSAGLDAMVSTGASSILLSDSALPGARSDAATPNALSPLPAATGTAHAFVLSSALQPTVLSATSAKPAAADTPDLLAELAVRAVAAPSESHYVVLAPTRYVDPQPTQAAATMLAIVASPWAQDLSVQAALTSVASADRGPLQPAGAADEISAEQVETMTTARNQVAAFRDCLTNQTAPTLLGGYAGGLFRATSAWWRLHPAAGQKFTSAILGQITALEGRVSILAPPGTHYTLSSGAPLEVTVRNNLSVAVNIRIQVAAIEGEQGFRASSVPLQTIDAGAQQQIKVPVHVDRSGYFRIRITLLTPHNLQLQTARTISVNSTALGAVALWITGIALGVLVLALVIRVGRRIAGRGRPKPGCGAVLVLVLTPDRAGSARPPTVRRDADPRNEPVNPQSDPMQQVVPLDADGGWGPLAIYTDAGEALAASAPASDDDLFGRPGDVGGLHLPVEQWSNTTYSGPRRFRPGRESDDAPARAAAPTPAPGLTSSDWSRQFAVPHHGRAGTGTGSAPGHLDRRRARDGPVDVRAGPGDAPKPSRAEDRAIEQDGPRSGPAPRRPAAPTGAC